MWSQGGARSSVLDRAKAQLSGQRISNISTDKRDVVSIFHIYDCFKTKKRSPQITPYICYGFGFKCVCALSLQRNFGTVEPQTRQTQFSDLSDVSSTSQTKNHHVAEKKPLENFSMGGGSRFLKKTSGDAAGDGRSNPGRTPDGTDTFIPQHSSQSAALSRLSLIENRFRNQKVKGDAPGVQTEPQDTRSPLQSSSDLSMTGSRFHKKRIASERQEQKVPQKTQVDAVVPGVNGRKVRTFSPDSDEQDMQRLLGDSFSLSEDIVRKPASPQPVNKVLHHNVNYSLMLFQTCIMNSDEDSHFFCLFTVIQKEQ